MQTRSLFPIVVMALLCCTARAPQAVRHTFFGRMDTVTEVTLVRAAGLDERAAWRSIDSILLYWEKRFSQTGQESEVRRINQRDDSVAEVSSELYDMISMATAYGDSLDGGFDLTILPVKELWGFGEEQTGDTGIPDPEQIADALERVDYRKVHAIGGGKVRFDSPGTVIDVGGIAKGFVLREVAKYLRNHGVGSFLISAGGDIYASGRKPDGTAWVIGIQHPRDRSAILATVAVDSGSIVTSGDYERYRVADGVRYHHLFSPSTGRSCGSNRSVTIWGPDPAEVDVLSTGLFCRPAAQIIAFAEARSRLEALVVDSAGSVHISSGWRGRVRFGDSTAR